MLTAFALLFVAWGCVKTPGLARYYPARLNEDDDWGLADADGNMIVSDQWKNAPFSENEGIVFVENKDEMYEYFKVGKNPQKIGDQYFAASHFSEGLAAVVTGQANARYIQYIDRSGKVKFDLKQLSGKKIVAASRFSEGLAWVLNEDQKFGYIDPSGKEVIKCSYDYADQFSEGLALVGTENDYDGKYGFIDTKGKVVIPFQANRGYGSFNEGFCWFFDSGSEADAWDGKFGTIDKKGKTVIAPSSAIQDANAFQGGVAVFGDGEYYGLINARGKQIVLPKYDWMAQLPAGIVVGKGEKWGVIDCKGKDIFSLTSAYNDITPIGKGRFVVMDGNKFRIVDKNGKQLCKNEFEDFGLAGAMGKDALVYMVSIDTGFGDRGWEHYEGEMAETQPEDYGEIEYGD